MHIRDRIVELRRVPARDLAPKPEDAEKADDVDVLIESPGGDPSCLVFAQDGMCLTSDEVGPMGTATADSLRETLKECGVKVGRKKGRR